MPGGMTVDGQMCTWPRSLELQLRHEGAGAGAGHSPPLSAQFTQGNLSLQPGARSVSQFAFNDGGKTFFGGDGRRGHIVTSSNPPAQPFSARMVSVSPADSYMNIIAGSFVTGNNWKQLNCPSAGHWPNKMVIYLCNSISETLSWEKSRMMGIEFFFLKHIPLNNMIYYPYVCRQKTLYVQV